MIKAAPAPEAFHAVPFTEWEDTAIPGMRTRTIWTEPNGTKVILVRFKKGTGLPGPHTHAGAQFLYCLTGRYRFLDGVQELLPGGHIAVPGGVPHGPTKALEDTVLLEVYES